MKVNVYTDGSSLSNPGKGGWACVAVNDSDEVIAKNSGGKSLATNNEMELTAFIYAMDLINKTPMITDVVLYSDSQYVLNSLTKGWAENWIRTNQTTRPNFELWKIAIGWYNYAKTHLHSLKFEWVKGHNNNRWNEFVDQEAKTQASKS